MPDDPNDPLRALDREATPPAELKSRVTGTLRERGLLRPRRSDFGRTLIALAAGLALFAVGRLTVRPATPPAGDRYVLLLYEDSTFLAGRDPGEFVAEYRAWGAQIRSEHRLVGGEKLASTFRLLRADGPGVAVQNRDVGGSDGSLAGYFVIIARDYEDAIAVARTHPHLKYGGRIAVRRIEPT